MKDAVFELQLKDLTQFYTSDVSSLSSSFLNPLRSDSRSLHCCNFQPMKFSQVGYTSTPVQ